MRTVLALIGMAAMAAGAVGCEQMSLAPSWPAAASPAARAAAPTRPAAPARTDYMADAAVKGDDKTDGQGAVDVALEWSRKYAQAAEQLLARQKENKELREANKKFLAQAARVQIQLEQSQKELGEANEMLVELSKELRQWKTNVLGFRDEMQQAQQVQMDAIKKVIVLLGGQVVAPAPKAADKPAEAKPAVSSKGTPDDASKGPNS